MATRIDCVSLGVVVNREGQRFYDEGEDSWPKRYAIWGRLVAQQHIEAGKLTPRAVTMAKRMPQQPNVAAELDQHGMPPAPSVREKLGKAIARESALWGRVIRDHTITIG